MSHNHYQSCLGLMTLLQQISFICAMNIWAASWQNQQNEWAPSDDSDQPWHPPSLIRVFAVCMRTAWVLSYPLSAQRRLWSDWADAQADLSLRWAQGHFVGFVMRRLILNTMHYIWTASSEFGTYRLGEPRRLRRACASAQSRQNLRCSLIQAVSQEEPSDRKPDPWPLWMAGHAQLKFGITEWSKTQIRLTGLTCYQDKFSVHIVLAAVQCLIFNDISLQQLIWGHSFHWTFHASFNTYRHVH